MLTNSETSYGGVAKFFHWVTAVLILALIGLGVFMEGLPAATSAEAEYKSWFYSLHKTIGVTLFAAALLRIVWALIQPHPAPLHPERRLETVAAATAHWVLYGSIVLMPLSGWLHHSALDGFAPIWWPFFQDLPLVPKSARLAEVFSTAHYVFALLLGLTIFFHVAGVIKHVLFDKDDTLMRMMPGGGLVGTDVSTARSGKVLSPILALLVFVGAFGVIAISHLTAPQSMSGIPVGEGVNEQANWRVNHDNSSLEFVVLQSGKPVTGHFGKWSAAIHFDPKRLENADVAVDVDIASLELGGVSQQATSADFLDVTRFPSARFEAKQFHSHGGGRFEAKGALTLAGQTLPLDLPFELKIADERATMTGETVIKRLDFGIGAKGFPGGGLVGLEIKVVVNLEADAVR